MFGLRGPKDGKAARVAAVGVTALVAATASVGPSKPARADDHQVPRVMLRASGERQTNDPYESWWTAKTKDGECVSSNAVGPRDFPPAMTVPSGEIARVRLRKKSPPGELTIRRWQVFQTGGATVLGPEEDVEFELRRKLAPDGTTIAWDAVFARPGIGEFYFEVAAQWKDRQGCDAPQGGYWTYHLAVSDV